MPRIDVSDAARADAMWQWRRLPEVNRWLGLAPESIDAFRERYLDADRLASMHVVELLPAGDDAATVPIGDIMIRIGDGWAQLEVTDEAKGVEAELGWVLDPEHTGRGYATEAIRAVELIYGRRSRPLPGQERAGRPVVVQGRRAHRPEGPPES